MAGLLEMSSEERERSHLVRACVEARLGQREASERLGIGVRQFKRLVRAWKQDGDAGLVSRQRGRASNRCMSAGRRAEIATLLKDKYAGLGATLASEKLLDWMGSRSRWRRFIRCKSRWAYGSQRLGGRSGCFSCVSGVRGLAN